MEVHQPEIFVRLPPDGARVGLAGEVVGRNLDLTERQLRLAIEDDGEPLDVAHPRPAGRLEELEHRDPEVAVRLDEIDRVEPRLRFGRALGRRSRAERGLFPGGADHPLRVVDRDCMEALDRAGWDVVGLASEAPQRLLIDDQELALLGVGRVGGELRVGALLPLERLRVGQRGPERSEELVDRGPPLGELLHQRVALGLLLLLRRLALAFLLLVFRLRLRRELVEVRALALASDERREGGDEDEDERAGAHGGRDCTHTSTPSVARNVARR